MAASPAPPEPRPTRDRVADVHVPFVYAALLWAVLGGFALAATLSAEALLVGISVSWATHAQVHGQLQVMGFAACFVVGVAAKLVPRFGNGRAPRLGFVEAAFWCLAPGLLGRILGQPLAYIPVFGALMVGGAALQAVGAALFAGAVIPVLASGVRSGAPHAILISAGALWMVAQAILGAAWLVPMVRDGGTILRADRDGLLLAMQLFGVLLGVFSGVGLRSFPTLFGMPAPGQRLGLTAAALLQGGLLGWVAGGLLDVTRLAVGGQAAVGAGVLLLIGAFGFWRRETRFAAASEPLAWAVRGALLSLAITAALLFGSGLLALLADRPVSFRVVDGTRHVFALGTITLGIVGMAQLILPEFASERLVRPPGRRRGPLFAIALISAMVLRGVVPMFAVSDTARFASMTVGSVIAWIAIGAFAMLFLRARRAHTAYLRRTAEWRARGAEGAAPIAEDRGR